MRTLTDAEILEDIAAFERRIETAREKLAMLPVGYLPYLAHKKREQARKALLDEISHIKRLRSYAVEGLAGK